MDAKEYNARKCTKTMTCVCAICGKEIEMTGKTCAAFGIYLCDNDICQREWRISQNIIARSDADPVLGKLPRH